MLYKENERYDVTKDEDFIKFKEYCDELKYPVVLVRNDKFIKKVNKVGGGFKSHLAPKFLNYEASERGVGGSTVWRYSKKPIEKDKDGYPTYPGDNGEFLDKMQYRFEEEDLEKLWFIVKKSNVVKVKEYYRILDLEKNYRERAKTESNKTGVKFFIFSEHSPMSSTQLKVIAKSFGIMKVDDMSIAKLQNVLFEHVDGLEKMGKGGYVQFMESTKIDQNVAIKANLQDAVELNIIGYNIKNNTWNWLDAKGKPMKVICQIKASEEPDKMDILLDHMISSDSDKDRLKMELNGLDGDGEVIQPEVDLDVKKIKLDQENGGYSYRDLQTLAKDIPGFKVIGKKRDELINELMIFHKIS